ncbi:MAG: prolyl oligopeptidase family serine peptidase [Opitutaceae bacterium]|nr:prolyl oligopeptidase family serine peptidase [Opitutaceae bacterium]
MTVSMTLGLIAVRGRRWLGLAALLTGLAGVVPAAETTVRRTWTVDGVEREGLLHLPAKATTQPVPLVFAFHGHGGSMRQAARSFDVHTLWPDAAVVYLQGLNTPGKLTDPEGRKAGWQHDRGEQGDRDLKFFDVVLADLRQAYRIDDRRIYAMGHSNGGIFTYLLWATRGDVFAAVAPSGAVAPRLVRQLKPKPMLHVAGEADPLVKYDWQRRMIDAVLKLNQAGAGVAWSHGGKRHASKIGAPVVDWTHPGGHEFPAAARSAIVTFLQAQTRPGD